ncbi:helix-turn-helix domain-containing protein [Clostridioides difficile]
MSVLSDRLKSLRKEKDVMQKDIAKFLNITTSAYGFYEQGKRTPTPEVLASLAMYFDTSVDYLVGLSEKEIKKNEDEKMEKVLKKLYHLNTGDREAIEKMIDNAYYKIINEEKK